MVSGDMAKNPTQKRPELLGGKLHVWNDQGPTGYTMTEIATLALPSIQAFAEKLWGTKGSKDYTEFQQRAALTQPVPGVTVFDRSAAKLPGRRARFAARSETLSRRTASIPSALRFAASAGRSRVSVDDDRWKFAKPPRRSARRHSYRPIWRRFAPATRAMKEKTVKGPKGKDVKTRVIRRGIGVVRAAGAPGADAASSHLVNDVSRVYSDPLPLNQWTKITIVGQPRRTTVYVDGRKAGESGEQALCPLARIGSQTGHSLAGKIRNLKIWDRALSGKEIGRAAGLNIPDNLAAHCPVTASASDTHYGLTPDKITDEELGTRWSSGMISAPQWVAIDLGRPLEFNTVTIAWEAARPKKLKVQVADEQETWRNMGDMEVSGDKTIATFPSLRARRVRLLMSQPATQWGYSIWEVEVLNYQKVR